MVSIITPVYNAENYIIQTVESVAAQTYRDWELLLVDDCSSDRSVERISEYIRQHPALRIRLLRQKENAGAAAARNRGVKEAEGRFIAFLDADDLWFPEKLERQMRFMEENAAGFSFTAYHFGDEQAVPTGKMCRVPKTISYRQALCRTIIFTSTVLMDTQVIPASYALMPRIPSEDTATWWRILREGHTGYGLDEPLVIYRRPGASLSSNKAVAVKRIWDLYRKQEHLSVPYAAFCMVRWAWRATARRLIVRK